MAYILIIETSTEICSVALTKNGKLVDIIESDQGQNHARLVTVFAEKLFAENKIKSGDLVAVAVSKGPGSYTGLRIGVSTAKGICYAAHIPLIAVGTLEAMTKHVSERIHNYNISDNLPVVYCPMIDARRMEVFSMILDQHGKIIKPISAEIIDGAFLADELSDSQVVFFGNGSEKCKEVLKSSNAIFISNIKASARHMCDLVWDAYNNKRFEDVAYFEPFYLKDFVATLPKKNILG